MNKVKNSLTTFAIKTTQFAFCLAVMTSANAVASSVADLTLTKTGSNVSTDFETTYKLNGKTISVTISETNGLTVSDNKNMPASQKGHFVNAGSYLVSDELENTNSTYIQTLVFDINSQQVRSYKISTENTPNHTIRIIQTSATEVKDSEALCSANIDGKLQFVNIDALGMLTQYLAIPDKSDSTLTVHNLRTLAIGPGIKSCALGVNYNASDIYVSDSKFNRSAARHAELTLYLADEYAGVWAMPADEEAEVERTLTFNQPDTPVEGVATLNGLEARNLFSSSSVTDSTVTNSPSTQSSLAAW